MISFITSNLDAEGNAFDIIGIPSIKKEFWKYHIHVLHNLPKQYIYGYLISICFQLIGNNLENNITKHPFTPLYTLIYTLVMQNTRFNKTEQKLSQIPPLKNYWKDWVS